MHCEGQEFGLLDNTPLRMPMLHVWVSRFMLLFDAQFQPSFHVRLWVQQVMAELDGLLTAVWETWTECPGVSHKTAAPGPFCVSLCLRWIKLVEKKTLFYNIKNKAVSWSQNGTFNFAIFIYVEHYCHFKKYRICSVIYRQKHKKEVVCCRTIQPFVEPHSYLLTWLEPNLRCLKTHFRRPNLHKRKRQN